MSGLNSTLSIAKTAIAAQQYGLSVTGNNIANVNNPDYSRQRVEQVNRDSNAYAGLIFGTGVDTAQITQQVNDLLEDRLTGEKSTQAAYDEARAYMNVLEGYFDEKSDSSISRVMIDFWNSFHDLSNNPLGSAERVAVYEKSKNFADRLNKLDTDLDDMTQDLNNEIIAAVSQVNSLSKQIAELNVQIVGLEGNQSANDLRDQRNGLVDRLGDIIDIDVFEQDNGAILVQGAGGMSLVSGSSHYSLSENSGKVLWQGSYGGDRDITEDISGGKLAGWLTIRDEVLPKVVNEMNILARETIWAMNYQHSQGAGLEYYTGTVTGTYQADQSGLFSSLDFGDKIDYDQDFTMWMQDKSSAEAKYKKLMMDMGISKAEISNWTGVSSDGDQYRYQLTVMDSGELGENEVIETSGANLAAVQSSTGDVADALDSALAEQTLVIDNGPSGTEVVKIKDSGGDALRSAASIAQTLSGIDGVKAYASEVSADIDVTGITAAEDGDEVQFSLYVDGFVYDQTFTVDSSLGTIDEQFEDALRDAANAINEIKGDEDLFTTGLNITSASGKTLGIQDFEVLDNAGVGIDNFANFNAGDSVTFTVASSGFGGSAATSTDVTLTIPSTADTTDQSEMAALFYAELSSALSGKPFSVEHDPANNSVTLRTTDGSDLTLSDGDNDTGLDASFDIANLAGTGAASGDGVLDFDGTADSETFTPTAAATDTIDFISQGTQATVEEKSAGGVNAATVVGTVTIVTEPGMNIQSTVSGAGGLFNGNWATPGSSIVTLGGEGGFSDFDNVVSFDVDGIPVTYDVAAAGHTTELEFAQGLEVALNAALPAATYSVIRNGKAVSVVKAGTDTDPIEIRNFAETVDGDAALAVRSGGGEGTNQPGNERLEAGNPDRDSATAALYEDSGIIKWEKLDEDGKFTGEVGLIEVDRDGTYTIVDGGKPTVSFDISTGTLVAGNTMTINTDDSGVPDDLDFTVSGKGNTKNQVYKFTVTTGGKVGEVVPDEEDIITIEWETQTGSGSFTLEVPEGSYLKEGAALEVEVDGMTLNFYGGTMFTNDVFTITTDGSGTPVATNEDGRATGELLSDWHWTLDSFANEFNRQAEGLSANVTLDNRLEFEASDEYFAMTNVEYSEVNGFNEENVSISVNDWSALNFSLDDFQIHRSASGVWGVVNDPTGQAVFLPADGDDNGFGIDFTGDGLADITLDFSKAVTGDGMIQFDLEKRDQADLGFGFSDDSVDASSGLLAAAGINTMFEGIDAMTIEVNETLADTGYVNAARIDSKTGKISNGDNSNAVNLANVQNQDITVKQWEYVRGKDPHSSLTTTTLDGLYSTITGSMGIISSRIQSSQAFAEIMVNNLTEQRDAISAVSLDEEMIRMMQYQHGFSAASKLLSVSDEMLNTLISMR